VAGASDQMNGILKDNHTKIDQLMTTLNETTEQMDRMVTQTNKTLTAGNTLGNLSDTMANLKAASVKLNLIEDDLHSLTGDASVQKDVRTTIANAAAASGHTNELISRLDVLAGGHGGHSFEFKPQTQLVFLQNFGEHKFRTDFDLYAPISDVDFFRVGVRDLTETNELNLQYGSRSSYNKRVSFREGIYADKVGLGADYDVFGPRHLSFDLYDPNYLRLDIRQRVPITKQSALWFGLENVPRDSEATLGFELRK